MSWPTTSDPSYPCMLCVQMRCATCHRDEPDYDTCAEHDWHFEPYMPDGSVPRYLYEGRHSRCQEAYDAYMEDVGSDPT